MIKKILNILRDIIKNIFGKEKLIYIVESLDWSIKWDGIQITSSLKKLNLINSDIRVTTIGLKNKVIHFGSVNTFINLKDGIKRVHCSNKIVLTWFHVESGDPRLKYIPSLNNFVEKVHTSCEKTKSILVNNGLRLDKVVVIPLGVDTDVFKTKSDNEKVILRKKLNISQNKIVIGSFQKDGVGWGEGLIPKLIKGPDVFCDVIEEISKKHDVHILLTGPSRGYVKNRLKEMKVSYTHIYLKKYFEIVDYYNIINLYIISSRVEGGPKALLECWATGAPVVSTRVGMVPDVSLKDKNVLMAEVDDTKEIIRLVDYILDNSKKRSEMINLGLEVVKNFSWEIISRRYFEDIYNNINRNNDEN